MSDTYLIYVCHMSDTCLTYVSYMSDICLKHNLSDTCLTHVWHTSYTCLRTVFSLTSIFVWHLSDKLFLSNNFSNTCLQYLCQTTLPHKIFTSNKLGHKNNFFVWLCHLFNICLDTTLSETYRTPFYHSSDTSNYI